MDAEGRSLAMNTTISHKILLITRSTQAYGIPRVTPITKYVKSKLIGKLMLEGQRERLKLFATLEHVPDGRSLPGLIYESLAHHVLGTNIDLQLVPMKLIEPSSGRRLPPWYSNHDLASDSSKVLRRNALQQTINFRFRPKAISEYGDSTNVVSGTYYIPRSKNQVGFDSFIHADDGFLYIFRFTISSDHDVNPKMEQYLKRISPMISISKWRFVFVAPSQSTLKSSQSRERAGLRLFSAILAPAITASPQC